jgi:DNA topoisomerase-1
VSPNGVIIGEAAAAVPRGLVYVSDESPGIRRLRRGAGFSYRRPDGAPLRDKAELTRIRQLAIPPAYSQVWICPLPHGHLQATGRDARGRKQYRYHAKWRTARDETKFDRMQAFGVALARIRARVRHDLAAPVG